MSPIRLAAAVGAGLVATLALAGPAAAHGADAPNATNYRTSVTTVAPALPGLSVRAIEAGARLELTNHTGRTIEVLGYDGEPYLEVRPDGVYENVRSPATYLNTSLAANVAPPATADPRLPPSWRRASTGPVARWHDRRTHWLSADPPPAVAAHPGREHRIRDWVVPLRDGASEVQVRGTLDWLPPPAPGAWWAAVALGAAGLAALGAVPARSGSGPAAPMARVPLAVLAVAAAAAGGAAVAFAVGRELDAGADGIGGVLRGLLLDQAWPMITALAAVVAGGLVLARRSSTDFALALAGALVALFAGVAHAAVFARSVAPVPWSAVAARLMIATVIAGGVGVALAATLRMRRAAHAAAGDGSPARPAGRVRPMSTDSPTGSATPSGAAAPDGSRAGERVRLAPGDPAPDFTLSTDTGDRVSLRDLRGRKVLLYAYPAAMTPGCTTQACDFRDSLASLKAAGYEVVGISPDKPDKLARFRERDALTFPLVSDPDAEVLSAYGAFGEKQLYGKTVIGVIRSTFVIDEEGRIARAMYNVKATGHVAKLRRDLGLD